MTTRVAAGASARPKAGRPSSAARERVLMAAYDLFSRQGVRAVGIDTIIAQAGVARMSFYHHFPSKDHLVLAFLEKREELWTHNWLEAEIRSRAIKSEDRLLAAFDVLDGWFQREDFEGWSVINVRLETFEPGDPVRGAATVHLANVRVFLRGLAQDAGVANPDDFARTWQILMEGAIVAAGSGGRLAARGAGALG